MSSDHLRHTLQNQLQADVFSNPAFDHLMLDYSNYHGMFLLLGTPIVILIGLTALLSWRKVIRIRRQDGRRTERRMTVYLGVVSTVTGLFLSLVLVANTSNVLNPRNGFSALVATLTPENGNSGLAQLRQSFDDWMSSGSVALPDLVREHIQERLSWQAPKAVLCGLLLLGLTVLTLKWWNQTFITEERTGIVAADAKTQLLLTVSILVIHLLALMFIANTQAAFAPITITMLYG